MVQELPRLYLRGSNHHKPKVLDCPLDDYAYRPMGKYISLSIRRVEKDSHNCISFEIVFVFGEIQGWWMSFITIIHVLQMLPLPACFKNITSLIVNLHCQILRVVTDGYVSEQLFTNRNLAMQWFKHLSKAPWWDSPIFCGVIEGSRKSPWHGPNVPPASQAAQSGIRDGVALW
jgi:hypothetical protein